jgi:putative SOS response-associated peptidase YedK
MCGRNSLGGDSEYLKERYSADKVNSTFNGSYNIAPSESQPVVRQGSIILEDMNWGFIPGDADNSEKWKKKSIINARVETVEEKDLFQDAVKQRRCLIPSTGFYEWKGSRGNKQPFHISWESQQTMSFAGIYSEYEDGKYAYSILTQDANDKIKEIHDRMPVILTYQEEKNWLKGNIAPDMIDSIASQELTIYPVKKLVNNPENKSKACIGKKGNLKDFA